MQAFYTMIIALSREEKIHRMYVLCFKEWSSFSTEINMWYKKGKLSLKTKCCESEDIVYFREIEIQNEKKVGKK